MPAIDHKAIETSASFMAEHNAHKDRQHPTISDGLPVHRPPGNYLFTTKTPGSLQSKYYDSRGSLVMHQSESVIQTSSIETDLWNQINKKEIYKTVCDWFQVWLPWQQKVILHGITNRCSTNQLEALATTLEPVFHQDCIAFHKKLFTIKPVPDDILTSRSVKPTKKPKLSASPSPLTLPNLPSKKQRETKKLKEPIIISLVSIDEKMEQKAMLDARKSADVYPKKPEDEVEHHNNEEDEVDHHKNAEDEVDHHKNAEDEVDHHKNEEDEVEHHKNEEDEVDHHKNEEDEVDHHKNEEDVVDHHKNAEDEVDHHINEEAEVDHHKKADDEVDHHKNEEDEVKHHQNEEDEVDHHTNAEDEVNHHTNSEDDVDPNTIDVKMKAELDQFAALFVENLIREVLEEHFRPAIMKDEYDIAHYISERVMIDALKSFKTHLKNSVNSFKTHLNKSKPEDGVIANIVDISDALGNLIVLNSTSTLGNAKPKLEHHISQERQRSPNISGKETVLSEKSRPDSKGSTALKATTHPPKRKCLTPGVASMPRSRTKSQGSSRGSLKPSWSYSRLSPEKMLPPSKTTPLKDIIQKELIRIKLTGMKHSIDSVDLVLADTSVDRRFGTRHHNSYSQHRRSRVLLRESPFSSVPSSTGLHSLHDVQGKQNTEIRTGQVRKPSFVQNLPVPYKKRFSQSLWSGNHHRVGMTKLKPDKCIHINQFSSQAEKVWHWMSEWADFEKLALLSEIIKLSGMEQMKYLTQCLFNRLKERLAINWLADHLLLLIFSNLSWKDIDTCAQVCKRWKYICSMDEIWMIKCLQYGQSENISDIIQRVIEANQDNQSIDWKMAFFELRQITKDAKSALAKPNTICISFEPSQVLTDDTSSSKVEIPLKRGTAAQLANDSQRLKRGFSSSADEDTWWNQREARSGVTNKSPGTAKSCRSTVALLPNIPSSNKKDGRTTNSLYNDSQYGGSDSAELSLGTPILQRGQESQVQSSPRMNRTQLAMSADKMTSISSEAAIGCEKLETKAVMQWIRGRRKPGKDDGEMALDIRPELIQAQDILGQCQSSYTLQWKDEDSKTSRKFAGKVPSVQRVRKFHGHMDSVLCLGISKRRLISGSLDSSVRVWDIKTGHGIHKMYGHKGAVTCLLFANNVLYTGSWDMTVMAWDLVKFSRKAVLNGHKGSISCLAMNDKYLFSASHDSTVRVWYRMPTMICKVLHIHDSHVMGIEVDESHIITASSDKTIKITDYLTGQCTKLVSNHPEPIHRMIVEDHLVITSTLNGHVYFWNKKTGEPEAGIQAHNTNHPINALAMHNGRLFTASGDQTVKEWDLPTMTCVRYLQGHKTPINDFKITDQRMVSCSSDGQIRVWDMEMDTKTADVTDDVIPYEIINQRDLE